MLPMTIRQLLLNKLYPLLIKMGRKKALVAENINHQRPVHPFYALKAPLNNGEELDFDTLRGKKVLIVNTASDCGYTAQYGTLQQLYEQYGEKVTVIAFPANDFKQQEKGEDAAIASFCKTNYGVTFPVARKSVVVKGGKQNNVFQWLTHKQYNGWNDIAPTWNFSKYLINEQGILTHYFDPAIDPLSAEVIAAVNK